jgi:hypothetical protein
VEMASFQADLQAATVSQASARKGADPSLGSRVGGFLRRLFGGVDNHA